MKFAIRACLLLLLTSTALVACGPGGDMGEDDKIVIRLGLIGFPDSPFDRGALKFKELLEARLPDRVEVRIYGAT